MTTAIIVQNRGSTRRVPALSMSGDDREIPDPLFPSGSTLHWVGFGGFSGTADMLGEGDGLTPGYEVGVVGTIALALSAGRVFGIVSSTEPTGPAVWLAASLADLNISSSGSTGVFKKRPQRIELRCNDWELLIGHVQSLNRASGGLQKGQEAGLLTMVTRAAG